MNKIILVLTLICSIGSALIAQEGYKIKLNIKGYQNDTLIVGYYYGKSQRVFDTIYAKKPGKFVLEAKDTSLQHGVYLALVRPDNNFFQFMVDEDQIFTITTDIVDLFNATPKGSDENKTFFNYLGFLKDQNTKVGNLQEKYKNKKTPKDSLEKITKLNQLNKIVTDYQNNIINKNPNGITSMVIKNDKTIEMPKFEGSKKEKQMAAYKYYRAHYFDHIDLSNDINLYTPGFDKKINDYLDKWTPNHPDTIMRIIDILLLKLEQAPDTYKYYLSTFINKYARSKTIGQDAIYVHLAKNYYGNEKAPWADKSTIKKILKEAKMMEGALIGKQAANVKLFKEDSTSLMLHDIKSKYTVLLFWSPTCGHCKKTMPKIIKFQEDYKDRGVQVVGICTKHQKDYKSCWKGVKDEHMENFLNLGDKNHRSRFKLKFNVRTTPKIFILDEDKNILLKDLPGEKLDEIMDSIIKQDNIENGIKN